MLTKLVIKDWNYSFGFLYIIVRKGLIKYENECLKKMTC